MLDTGKSFLFFFFQIHAQCNASLNHILLYLLRIRPTHRSILTEIPRPQRRILLPLLLTLLPPQPPEKHPLTPLPRLDAREEQRRLNKHNSPLPRNPRMLEHHIVNHGDIQDRERKHESRHDPKEEELVPPHVHHPLREIQLGLGLHAEEAAPHVHHLPGEEEREPGHADEGGCARAEHCVAFARVVAVAAGGEVAVAPGEEDEREGGEAERGHPDTVDDGVDDDFPGEDSLFLFLLAGCSPRS